ncbi:MAG TPA: response regulator [Candidatus Paceibacterota bacterium]|nr:response regulator [Candidatus Paceibacterota bacterium]
MKVLVAEDDSLLSSILINRFQSSGFDVMGSFDGDETVDKIKSWKPGLILLDILMPKKDGFAVLEEIKKDPACANIPVIVLSNLGEENDRQRASKFGVIDYLVKANTTPKSIVEKVQAMKL